MFPRRKSLAHPMAALGAILRRVGRIHSDHFTASVCSFARKDRTELTPAGVTDALGEMMVFHHPAHVQIFNGNRVKFLHDVQCRLMVKVRALPLNFLMLARQKFYRLTSAVASSVCSAGHLTLSGLQFPLCRAQVFRILNHFTGRESGEVLNPNVNSDCIASLREESGLILFNRKDHVPPICLTFDRAGFDRPFNLTGQTNAARTDPGEMKLIPFKAKRPFHLREGEGIVPIFRGRDRR